MEEDDDVDDVEFTNEERFQQDLLQDKMISRLQTSLPKGEPSTRYEDEDGLYEEELVDFELTPPCSPTLILFETKIEEEDIVYSLVVGLEVVGGVVEAPTCASKELAVETTTILLESGTEKLPDATEQLPSKKSPSEELQVDGTFEKSVQGVFRQFHSEDSPSRELQLEPSGQLQAEFVPFKGSILEVPARKVAASYFVQSPSTSESLSDYLNFTPLELKGQDKRKRSDFVDDEEENTSQEVISQMAKRIRLLEDEIKKMSETQKQMRNEMESSIKKSVKHARNPTLKKLEKIANVMEKAVGDCIKLQGMINL